MATKEEMRIELRDVIENLSEDNLIEVWDDFCDKLNWDDKMVWYWNDGAIDDKFQFASPTEIATAILNAETYFTGRTPELGIGDKYTGLILFDKVDLIKVLDVGIDDLIDDIIEAPEEYMGYAYLHDVITEEEEE